MTHAPPDSLLHHFRRAYGTRPTFAVRAPGRVTLVGAHVDYNDGCVLPAAITRFVWLAVGPAGGDVSHVTAADFDESVTLRVDASDPRLDADGNPLPTWALYPAGVAWVLRSAGLETPALNAVLTGDVPIGGGLSSSAAVEVAFAAVWQRLGGWRTSRIHLARLCMKAEREVVGVASGLMDQFASLFGQKGHALLLDPRTLDWEALPLPSGTAIVVADTTTRRQLSDGGLNTRHAECREAIRLLKPHLPEISALRDVTADDLNRLESHLPEPIRSRAGHVVGEIARVSEAAEALRHGDAARLGALMNDSYASSRDLYQSSGPELDAMWAAGNAHPACLGGRFVGAGFGGCVVFLTRADEADKFVEETGRRYALETGLQPDLYVVGAADGAQVVPVEQNP